jgi:hypothetical protein
MQDEEGPWKLLAWLEQTQPIERTGDSLEQQIEERSDALDIFFEGLRDAEEQRKAQELADEVQSIARVPVKLTNNQMRLLATDPGEVEDDIKDIVVWGLTSIYATRVIGAVENRLNESLEIDKSELQSVEWGQLSNRILDATEEIQRRQRERLVGGERPGPAGYRSFPATRTR